VEGSAVSCRVPGSIKGDVKRKYFSLRWNKEQFPDIQPLWFCLRTMIRNLRTGFMCATTFSVLKLNQPGRVPHSFAVFE
jgi:hypothetical protein